MDNQPIEQKPASQPIEPSMMNVMSQSNGKTCCASSSSCMAWCIVGAVVIIAALAAWYFYSTSQTPGTDVNMNTATTETATLPSLSEGNTTADIANDLNQIPDDAAALDASAAALSQEVQGL